MIGMDLFDGFLIGIAGGMIPELYALYNLRHTFHESRPGYLKSWFYWAMTVVMILLGGCTVVLYLKLGINVNVLMALHLGIATPLIIATALKEKPTVD